MKYVKKLVEIEAEHFSGHQLSAADIIRWARRQIPKDAENPINPVFDSSADQWTLEINTLEGVMVARPGDYIIRGVQGEFYPCKPDIFEQTYEAI